MSGTDDRAPRHTEEQLVRQWAVDNLPSPTDLDTAARVCIQLADICERMMPWWERLFYSAKEMRDAGRKCAEMAIRVRSYFSTPNSLLDRSLPPNTPATGANP
jgi:hypothetical protein